MGTGKIYPKSHISAMPAYQGGIPRKPHMPSSSVSGLLSQVLQSCLLSLASNRPAATTGSCEGVFVVGTTAGVWGLFALIVCQPEHFLPRLADSELTKLVLVSREKLTKFVKAREQKKPQHVRPFTCLPGGD